MSQQDRRGLPDGSQQGGYEAAQRQAQGGDPGRSAAGSNYGDWSGSRGAQETGPAGPQRGDAGREPGNCSGQDCGNSGRPGSGENPPGRSSTPAGKGGT